MGLALAAVVICCRSPCGPHNGLAIKQTYNYRAEERGRAMRTLLLSGSVDLTISSHVRHLLFLTIATCFDKEATPGPPLASVIDSCCSNLP